MDLISSNFDSHTLTIFSSLNASHSILKTVMMKRDEQRIVPPFADTMGLKRDMFFGW